MAEGQDLTDMGQEKAASGNPNDTSDFPRPTTENLLRVTRQNNLSLSMMADHKANIVIGASFIILSILVTQLGTGRLSLAMLSLGVFTALAAAFALMAVIPSNRAAPKGHAFYNPLFYNSSATMSEEEYLAEMKQIFSSNDDVYDVMLRELYQSGVILHKRKFRNLQISYTLFFLGLVVTLMIALYEYSTGVPGAAT